MSRWCAVVLAVLLAACGSEAPPAQRAQAPAPPVKPVAPVRPAVAVEIVSINPATIDVRGGRVVPTTFQIEYRIAEPEKISEAEVRVQSPGFGVLQRQPIPVAPSGIVQLTIDVNDDFGPVVRFRAVCPGGTTEWRALGTPLDTSVQPPAGVIALTSISPSEIRPSYTGDRQGGFTVGLHGTGLTQDCTIEGERDGSSLPITNPSFRDRALRGFVAHREIDDRPVARRYLEVGLSIRGPGIGKIAITRLPFNE